MLSFTQYLSRYQVHRMRQARDSKLNLTAEHFFPYCSYQQRINKHTFIGYLPNTKRRPKHRLSTHSNELVSSLKS